MNPKKRSALYQSIARMLGAGVPAGSIAETLRTQHRSSEEALVVESIDTSIGRGETLSSALESLPTKIVPRFHSLVIKAAETAGKVPEELRRLAEIDERQEAEKKQLISKVTYPLVIFHFAAISTALVPGPGTGSGTAWLYAAIAVAIDIALIALWKGVLSPTRRESSFAFLSQIPGLRQISLDAEYGQFLRVVGHLYEAGVPIAGAAEQASETLSDPTFAHTVKNSISQLEKGRSVAETLPLLPSLRTDISATISTSEPAGELGSAFLQTATLSDDYANQGRLRVVKTIATALFIIAVAVVAHRVISFYAGVFSMIE